MASAVRTDAGGLLVRLEDALTIASKKTKIYTPFFGTVNMTCERLPECRLNIFFFSIWISFLATKQLISAILLPPRSDGEYTIPKTYRITEERQYPGQDSELDR